MVQKVSPFLEGKYGWSLGESNWNLGMDENLVKFSYMFNRNIDGVVSSLPAPVNGEAYFLTTDNRLYFAVDGIFYSSPTPKWFTVYIKSTGQAFQFNGTTLVESDILNQANDYTDVLRADVLNSADPLKGATIVGYDGTNVAAHLDSINFSLSALAIATNTTQGAGLIGYRGRTVHDRLDDYLDAADYGVVGDGVTDDWAAINAFLDLAYAQNKVAKFPGWMVCAHSQKLELYRGNNFAIVGDGFPTLKYTGIIADVAVSIDRGPMGGAYGIVFRDFNIEGNFVCTDAFYNRAISHSDISNIRAWGGTACLYRVVSGVCNNYTNLRLTSVGGRVGAPTGTPAEGIRLESRSAGDYLAWCTFANLIVENVLNTGIRALDATGNLFTSGTSEGNGRGLLFEEPCRNNTVINMDFEANGAAGDIVVNGHCNSFHNPQCISSGSSVNISVQVSKGATFFGGYLRAANLQSASSDTTFIGCEFSDNGALGITGTGSHRRIGCYKTDNAGNITSRYVDILGAFGSFTPSLVGSTTPGVNTYSVRTGRYEVIAGRCFFEITIVLTAKDAAMAGIATISGLPVASSNIANLAASGQVGTFGNIASPGAGYTGLGWRIDPNSTSMLLITSGFGNATATVSSTSIGATSTLNISGSYPIA